MSEVHICPVCGGKGIVPNGFYIAVGTPYYSTTSTAPETCRSCGGKGIIIVPDSVPSFGEHISCDCTTCRYCSDEVYTSLPPKIWCKNHEQYKYLTGTCPEYQHREEKV